MKITIDGRPIEVRERKTLLEIARENGIAIPSLCDHPRLAPYSACRLCLVEIRGRPGTPPSCSTYPEEGMEVRTDTEALASLRRGVLELILSEHPSGCLLCTEKEKCEDHKASIRKAGETTGCVFCPADGGCDLQETVRRLKVDNVPYPALYRGLEVRRDDPFFVQDYNLCILCGRCVRVCAEVRGAGVLAFGFRGSQTVVGTTFDKSLVDAGCQFCGACVDVCPTGALSERATRYEARPDSEAETVCPVCGVGCRLTAKVRGGRLQGTVPAKAGPNEGQACVRGRFALADLVNSPRRLLSPMVRRDGKLKPCSWDEALAAAAEGLKSRGGGDAAMVISPQLGLEDIHVLAKLGREALQAGSIASSSGPSILDALASISGARADLPRLLPKLADVAKASVILVAGEDVAVTHPVAWVAAHEAVCKGARLVSAGAADFRHDRHATARLKPAPGGEAAAFLALSRALADLGHSPAQAEGLDSFRKSLAGASLAELCRVAGVSEDEVRAMAAELKEEGPKVFLVGASLNNPDALAGLWNLAVQSGSAVLPLAEESNTWGLWRLLCGHAGKAGNADALGGELAAGRVRALYLAGPLPLPSGAKPEFLVVQDSFASAASEIADVVLPAATFAESGGTFINMEYRVQAVEPSVAAAGESKPDWWIASALAAKLGAEGFAYAGRPAVRRELDGALLAAGAGQPVRGYVPAPSSAKSEAAGRRPGTDRYRSMPLADTSPDFRAVRARRREGSPRGS